MVHTNSIRRRLVRGLSASICGPLVSIVIQLVSLPIFLKIWGAGLYGEWLILSSLPTYLALSDVGFGSVAGNDMTFRVAGGDHTGALETFHTTWTLISSCSLLLGVIVFVVIIGLPIPTWLHLHSIAPFPAQKAMIMLCVYALLSLQTGLIQSAFRCDNHYATGMWLINALRLSEASVATVTVLLHGSVLMVAGSYLVLRVLGTAAMIGILRKKSPWLRYGISHASLARARKLWVPAFAYAAFPAGNAVSLQGIVFVAGMTLGPVAAAAFATMRTLSRAGFQVMEAIKNSVWPELSVAYGTRDLALARRLHRIACQAALWLSVLLALVFWFVGGRVFAYWTHGRLSCDPTAFRWLVIVAVANSFWYTSSVVTIAANAHTRMATLYLGGTFTSVLLARFLMPHFGLAGAAMSLLAIDMTMGWYVIRTSLKQLKDEIAAFIASLFDFDAGLMAARTILALLRG